LTWKVVVLSLGVSLETLHHVSNIAADIFSV